MGKPKEVRDAQFDGGVSQAGVSALVELLAVEERGRASDESRALAGWG